MGVRSVCLHCSVIVVGLTLTALVWVLATLRERALRLAERMTAQLRESRVRHSNVVNLKREPGTVTHLNPELQHAEPRTAVSQLVRVLQLAPSGFKAQNRFVGLVLSLR